MIGRRSKEIDFKEFWYRLGETLKGAYGVEIELGEEGWEGARKMVWGEYERYRVGRVSLITLAEGVYNRIIGDITGEVEKGVEKERGGDQKNKDSN